MKPAGRWRRIAAVILAGLLAAGSASGRVSAQTSGELLEQIQVLEAQEQSLQEAFAELEAALQSNQSQLGSAAAQKSQLDQQISLLYGQIENTNAQLRTYTLLIADKQQELERAQEELSALNQKHKERIQAMEEQNDLSYWSVLFRASSFSELLDNLELIREIAEADSRRLQELRDAADRVETAKAELENEKAALEATEAELLKWQRSLEEKQTQTDMLLQELLSQEGTYEQLLEESEQKQEALMQQLAQLENAYAQKTYEEWLATSIPETTQPETVPTQVPQTTHPEETVSAQTPETAQPEETVPQTQSTLWLNPVPYYIFTSPFGMRLHPELNIWRMHNGVDLSCDEGTPIYASRSGVVTVTAYQEGGAGNYVQLDHGDGYRSVYMHMTHYIVSVGQYVSAGEVIGYVGSTGLSSGNHLHFGISYNGTYVNPMEYLP